MRTVFLMRTVLAALLALPLLACSRYDYQERRIGDETQLVRIHRLTGRAEVLHRSYSGGEYWKPIPTQAERFAADKRLAALATPTPAPAPQGAPASDWSHTGVAFLRRIDAMRGGDPGQIRPDEFRGASGPQFAKLCADAIRCFETAARLEPAEPKHNQYLEIANHYCSFRPADMRSEKP